MGRTWECKTPLGLEILQEVGSEPPRKKRSCKSRASSEKHLRKHQQYLEGLRSSSSLPKAPSYIPTDAFTGDGSAQKHKSLSVKRKATGPPSDHVREAIFLGAEKSSVGMGVRSLPHTRPGWVGLDRGKGVERISEEKEAGVKSGVPGKKLHPLCNSMVRRLVENKGWKYVENRERYAKSLTGLK